MKKNLYELLEVPLDATQEQIKAAMVRLGKKYATKSQTNETARAYFNQIKEAYKILSNPYRRAGYDDSLKLNQSKKTKTLNKHQYDHIKQWIVQKWKTGKPWVLKPRRVAKSPPLKRLPDTEPHLLKEGLDNQPSEAVIPSWKIAKQQAATKYISQTLIPGEKIMYQTYTHWFFYLDFGAVLLVGLSIYLLVMNPVFIGDSIPTVPLWVPKLISKELLTVSVWRLGLMTLLLIGLMMLGEAFIVKQTTELAVTSKRVIAKFGFLNRTIIELKLRRFESITINQSLLGRIFNYGTITITGMGGVKTMVPNVIAPLQFKKILWQVLEYLGHESGDKDSQ